MIMAAQIGGGTTPQVLGRTELFSAIPYRRTEGNRMYHVAPDGRFLMMRLPASLGRQEDATPRITVVLNWFEEVEARVGR